MTRPLKKDGLILSYYKLSSTFDYKLSPILETKKDLDCSKSRNVVVMPKSSDSLPNEVF